MKKNIIIALALLFSLSLSAAPREKEDDAWIQKCKKHKIFGISIGMTAGQVRSAFLKAQKTTLLPWSATTPYSSYFRFDMDTGFIPLDASWTWASPPYQPTLPRKPKSASPTTTLTADHTP